MAVILIVDDDDALRSAMAIAVGDLGHEAREASSGEAALRAIDGGAVDGVLLDLRMAGIGGMETLRRIRARPDPPPVAVITAVPSSDNTIEAMRLGAVDHLTKPVGRAGLRDLLARLLDGARPPSAAPAAPDAAADALIGVSPAMRDLQKAIGLVADSDATVLLLGETGTGKEVVARAIHRHGHRNGRPFVAVNCAAIPSELLESLLFGHVRGAFSGAVADRPGSFREAAGGTLFLDEIGDMGLAMQAKLLRTLQERTVTPVGGRTVAVDVRIVAATHRDLLRAVRLGTFREDLYYRLGVVPLSLPPLRARPEDLLPLATYFLACATRGGTAPPRLSAAAAERLGVHRWPGNVRELRNAMERLATMLRRPVIEAADLDFLRDGEASDDDGIDWLSGSLPDAVARLERAMIARALAASGGNRSQAAERLGIRRQFLYGKLARHGMLSADATDTVLDADEDGASETM